MKLSDWLTSAEAVKLLGYSRARLYQHVKNENVGFKKVANRSFFRRQDVVDVKNGKTKSTKIREGERSSLEILHSQAIEDARALKEMREGRERRDRDERELSEHRRRLELAEIDARFRSNVISRLDAIEAAIDRTPPVDLSPLIQAFLSKILGDSPKTPPPAGRSS